VWQARRENLYLLQRSVNLVRHEIHRKKQLVILPAKLTKLHFKLRMQVNKNDLATLLILHVVNELYFKCLQKDM